MFHRYIFQLSLLLIAALLSPVLKAAAPTDINLFTYKKIIASDGAASDEYGTSVAIDGDTAIVGAAYDDDQPPFSRPPVRPYGCSRGRPSEANS